MTRKDKLLHKFLNNPHSLNFADIEKILVSFGFEIIPAKGSHVKFKRDGESDLIIPIHNNQCKDFYKRQAKIRIEHIINNQHENS